MTVEKLQVQRGKRMEYFGGIDLGGTHIAAGIVNEEYEIIGRSTLPVGNGDHPREICRLLAGAVQTAAKNCGLELRQIRSIGIGVPGAVCGEEKEIRLCNNLGLDGFPLKTAMEEMTGKPISLENDANAAVYGEMLAGAGTGRDQILMFTLGTGVGTGILKDRKIFAGSRGMGAELGHMVIEMDGYPCTCGRRGCFEAYASASGLIHICEEAMKQDLDSSLWPVVRSGEKLNGKMIFEAADQGDLAAVQAVSRYYRYLTAGIANGIRVWDPDCVIIGGGISNRGPRLTEELQERLTRELGHETDIPPVLLARLGNDAGIIGAACLGKGERWHENIGSMRASG